MFLEIAAWLAAAGLGLEPSDNFPTGFLHDSVHRRNFETQKMGARYLGANPLGAWNKKGGIMSRSR
jgi:hypothetical protein